MKREETIEFNIKAVWHAISRMYNQKGQDRGISTSTGFVLLNIHPDYGSRATKIAPLLGMEATSLSRLLKAMEEQEFIYRQPDPDDGRAVRVFLTEKGKLHQDLAQEAVMEFNEAARQEIGSKDLSAFFRVLNKINKLIELQSI